MILAIAAAAALVPATVVQGTTAAVGGLQTTTFNLPEGRLTVLLPADVVAGDTISGTVIAVPNGTGAAGAANEATLQGLVVDIEGAKPRRPGMQPTWLIPAVPVALLTVTLFDPDGEAVGTCDVPALPKDVANAPSTFGCDPVTPIGNPIQITGPFDGDTGNTSAKCGSPLAPLAESPRSCVFSGVQSPPGAVSISVTEGGKSATLPCNAITVQLSAPKTTLLAGEATQLTMTVSGLNGLSPSEYPVPVEITNLTPDVVRFAGAHGSVACLSMPLSSVQGGVGTLSIGLVGIKPGNFMLRGIFFGLKMHDVKKAMNLQTFRAWVRALIISYEAKIKDLEAQLKESPNNTGLQANLGRKKNILEVLRAGARANNNDLDVMKTLVDKALADDAFFALAAELISLAAEMLGYTDIPMPGIGTIVKGMKALAGAAKLAKTLAALEAAEKLIDAYETAADKAEQLEKIKDALDKVQEALDDED
jgi:hypothetical protein